MAEDFFYVLLQVVLMIVSWMMLVLPKNLFQVKSKVSHSGPELELGLEPETLPETQNSQNFVEN